jgi:hypothetical protein
MRSPTALACEPLVFNSKKIGRNPLVSLIETPT